MNQSMDFMQDLKGKAVVITGASGGTGEATAVELATKGCERSI